jgi:DNA-binding XRE family transcriptional regulator
MLYTNMALTMAKPQKIEGGKNKLNRDILTQLFEARVARRKTQTEIGKFVGVSHPMVGYWEKGVYEPNLKQFIDWCYSLQFIVKLENQKIEP